MTVLLRKVDGHGETTVVAGQEIDPASEIGESGSCDDASLTQIVRQEMRAHTRPLGGVSKRMFDIVVATLAIVATLPVMIVVFLFYLIEGSPFYSHSRVGFAGRMFKCHKFRTMVRNGDEVLAKTLASDPKLAELWKTHRKLPNDPRVTTIGKFLRKSSLDELPQLFNVLKGEMSCVGPRPVTEEELEDYGKFAAKYASVRPGLTGLWQVSGRNDLNYAERVRLDVSYIDNWSLWTDFQILLRTPIALMKFRTTS